MGFDGKQLGACGKRLRVAFHCAPARPPEECGGGGGEYREILIFELRHVKMTESSSELAESVLRVAFHSREAKS